MIAPKYGVCCGNILHSRANGLQCCLNAAKRIGYTYSKRKQVCCNQDLYDRRKWGCCGGQPYKLTEHYCCGNRRLLPRDGVMRCCREAGTSQFREYDKTEKQCCGPQLISKSEICCGGSAVPKPEKCCAPRNTLISMATYGKTLVGKGDQCCRRHGKSVIAMAEEKQ